jgi:hypothetical protein
MMAIQGNHRGPAALTSRGGAASAKRGSADSRRANEDDKSLARLKRALRKAERRAGDGSDIGGTGATILKLLPAPLARLLDKGRIGTEEVRAADDIAIAFHAQAGALSIIASGAVPPSAGAWSARTGPWCAKACSPRRRPSATCRPATRRPAWRS